jgi:CheY-like chemotaxis protein
MKTLRVLVVDDNEDTAELLKVILGMAGHEARIAYDGEAALEQVRTFAPHAAILDIGLPRMNGYDLARKLREVPGLQQLHLIATTGFSDDEDKRRAERAGFDRFLVKPVDAEEIGLMLSELSR